MIKIPVNEALIKLKRQKTLIDTLGLEGADSAIFKKWKRDTEVAITFIFGDDTRHLKEFKNISFYPLVLTRLPNKQEANDRFLRGLGEAIYLLESFIDEINEYHTKYDRKPNEDKNSQENKTGFSKNIFIVHGKDEEMLLAISELLKTLEFNPIILREQPNKGKTIIEKFEAYSDVSFAIVLFSPDDLAFPKDSRPELALFRARQNTVLELGFFIGKLGRNKVAVIFRQHDKFEMPSDYSGVLFTPYDNSGKWKFDLLRELKVAGYSVDANKMI